MSRPSRKRSAAQKTEPTPDQIRLYMQCLADEHQQAWHDELMDKAPHWGLPDRFAPASGGARGDGSCGPGVPVMRAALYARVSTYEQNPESQMLDLRQLAAQRGWEITETYVDHGVSGTRARRPALDRLMADAIRHRFDVVAVAGFDRMARSVRHLLETLDELHRLGIEFISLRENIDSGAPLGRALFTIVGAVAELEKSLIRERVRAGMRRAKLEGQQLGRPRLNLDEQAILRDRARGLSLGDLAKRYETSRTTIRRVLATVPKGVSRADSQLIENRQPETAA